MAAIENITSARLLTCDLKGFDIKYMTRTVTIRESLCSPYLTGEILVLDNQNVIVDMQLEGGDPCMILFDAPAGKKKYKADMYVLDVKAESSPENMMLKIYTISLTSSEYFTDRGTLTRGNLTSVGMNGVALVRQIWSEAGFKTPLVQEDTDKPLQDGENSLSITHQKPFTAIGQVRDIQNYPANPTINVLLYRDCVWVHHVPLQYVYKKCAAAESFIQKETWGINYQDLFLGSNSEAIRMIIDAKDVSRLPMLNPDEFKPTDQGQRTYDIKKGKMAINVFQGLMKGTGPNLGVTDSQKTTTGIDPQQLIENARWFAHCMKSRPQYLVKVPLNSGINITVGNGCDLTFTPLHTNPNSSNKANGLYLITDLIHEVHNDLRVVNGTTTMNCLQARGECNI